MINLGFDYDVTRMKIIIEKSDIEVNVEEQWTEYIKLVIRIAERVKREEPEKWKTLFLDKIDNSMV